VVLGIETTLAVIMSPINMVASLSYFSELRPLAI
jgi:hypothetical protein